MKVRCYGSGLKGGDTNEFNERVERMLNDPPEGYFVHDVKFTGTVNSENDWVFSVMVIYGEIPAL